MIDRRDTFKLSFVEHWQDWNTGKPKPLGDLWTLEKNGRKAVCVLQGHPIGCELRVEVDGDFKRSAAFKEGTEAIATADEWKTLFAQNGWCQGANGKTA